MKVYFSLDLVMVRNHCPEWRIIKGCGLHAQWRIKWVHSHASQTVASENLHRLRVVTSFTNRKVIRGESVVVRVGVVPATKYVFEKQLNLTLMDFQ